MAPAEYRGRPAAPGTAAGPLVRIDRRAGQRTGSGSPAQERADLQAAVAAAIASILALAGTVEGEAAEMLDFQVAMLEDTVLVRPALDRIAAGSDAATAWSETIAAEAAGYKETEDEYFRARATDVEDLGDRVLGYLLGEADYVPPAGAVLVGDEMTPSRFLAVDWSAGGGIALFSGSPSSHVAMLARSRGVPMVVGLGAIDILGHDLAIVDGDAGRIILSPGKLDWEAFEAARDADAGRIAEERGLIGRPARTADGEPVSVLINVAGPEELDSLDPAGCDGIGLVRTEFLFHGSRGLPDEETQYRAYCRMIEWAAPRPVVLRTLDAGGDKPIPGLTVEGKSNPFLGTRGIRLSLARPDIFRVQLRAMARAAVHGDARIMLPMVTIPGEIDAAAAILEGVLAELAVAGIAHRLPPLGIMVEVPAVAIEPALFARAAFFSIGSNDLTQYVTASARDTGAVAALNDPGHPAVVSLIRRVVETGAAIGRDVSLCGDMGGDPAHLPALIKAGLRSVSVAPLLVGRAKRAIAGIRTEGS